MSVTSEARHKPNLRAVSHVLRTVQYVLYDCTQLLRYSPDHGDYRRFCVQARTCKVATTIIADWGVGHDSGIVVRRRYDESTRTIRWYDKQYQ
jgi:hypothetical protein